MTTFEPVKPHVFIGRMGMARIDITPPDGINSRVWGAATHEIAEGVHMPLTATAWVIVPEGDAPRVIISADLCWIGSNDDWHDYRLAIAEAAGIPDRIDNVLLSMAHTHAAPPLDRTRTHLPGGEHIEPYMASLRDSFMMVTREAVQNAVDAQLTVEAGTCSLAQNRDLLLEDKRYACGYNPHGQADNTLLVGRITDRNTHEIIGTIVNYACHPTTLSWENTLISPDFVGTMRTTIEGATGHAPCLFLQGASGELSAREGHQGETAVAERQGRQLGYAALSVLEGMIPADKQLNFGGIKESGATLAYWRPAPLEVTDSMCDVATHNVTFGIPIKSTWPTLDEFKRLHETEQDRVMKERYLRRIGSRQRVGDGTHYEATYTFWRLGDIILTTTPTEMYSDYQVQLRAAFPDTPILVGNLVNGSLGYIVPPEYFNTDLYQAEMTPFDSESLENGITFAKDEIKRLIDDRA